MSKRRSIWTTNEGTKLRICDIGDSHLVNILRWIEEHRRAYSVDVYSMMAAEAIERGLITWSEHKKYFPYIKVTAEEQDVPPLVPVSDGINRPIPGDPQSLPIRS